MQARLKPTLVPSLPADSFEELESLALALDGVADGFQIDIVDGQFVPSTSWPFTEADLEAQWTKIESLPGSFKYELDCMIKQPEQYLDIFTDLPISRLIVHVGSTDKYGELIKKTKANNLEFGLAFTNDVPISFVKPYLNLVDFVQIMGIAKVGKQGQPFDERTLTTAKTLRDENPDLFIAVDGSVNVETIPQLLRAGVNHFAPGSAISRAADPVAAYKQLLSLIEV